MQKAKILPILSCSVTYFLPIYVVRPESMNPAVMLLTTLGKYRGTTTPVHEKEMAVTFVLDL